MQANVEKIRVPRRYLVPVIPNKSKSGRFLDEETIGSMINNSDNVDQ